MIDDIIEDLRITHLAIGRDVSIYSRAADEIRDLRLLIAPFAHQAKIIDENDKAEGRMGYEYECFRFRGSMTSICLGDMRRCVGGTKNEGGEPT